MSESDVPDELGVEVGDADEQLEACTDEEWREAHRRLAGVIPPEELAYTWAPGQTPEEAGL